MPKPLLIIDLDGTFVSVNTFHKWMIFVAKQALKKLGLKALSKILYTIALRAFKRINHAQMKYAILEVSEKLVTDKEIEIFVNTLEPYVHLNILKILEEKNISILATAAPLIYAKAIKEKYGFDYVIATSPTSIKPWKENLKEEKKKNLLALLKEEDIRASQSILYTDHHDDLPLMRYANETYLVGDSKETLEKIEEKNINIIALNILPKKRV